MRELIARLRRRGQDGRTWTELPRYSGRVLAVAILASLLIHLASGSRLRPYSPGSRAPLVNNKAVKIRIVEAPKPVQKKKEEARPPDSEVMPKILEMPQVKTERPEEADHVGNVDHKAKKETRISEKVQREKAKDAGQKGNPDSKAEPTKLADQAKKLQTDQQKQDQAQKLEGIKSTDGTLGIASPQPKPRNDYEALLPTNITDLPGQVNAGYQDYVDDKITEGDRIDINTTEYRYIGYFTNMRKAIELVWNYPTEASRKGLQGEVGLEFAIGKDGKATGIKVIKSSGYQILDKAIVEAIRLASPFSPLPDGFGKARIVITGSFRYILNAYGSH